MVLKREIGMVTGYAALQQLSEPVNAAINVQFFMICGSGILVNDWGYISACWRHQGTWLGLKSKNIFYMA